jgi:DNA modification methylase
METNVIYCGDNLEVMPKYIPDESVDLIYIDPPFNTSRQYEVFWGEAQEKRAFEDRFGDAMTYLDWMKPRIVELYRALKPTGSFYYHCDWHASHYIKVLLDQVFGFNYFRNEIIWERATAHYDSKKFRIVHDTILFYTKGSVFTFNRQFGRYSESYMRSHYNLVDGEGRPYRLDNLTSPNPRPNLMYEWKGVAPPAKGWRFSKDEMERLDKAGRIYYSPRTGRPQLIRYLDEMPGVLLGDVWTGIPPVNSQALQRLGYPTQKPLPLMERIIQASSNEGDAVLDAFCGCGTTLEAAAKHKRRWIGIDFSPTACRLMSQRLEGLGLKEGVDFQVRDMPKSEDDLRRMPHFEFQNWAVIALGGIPNRVKVGDYGIDGRLYVADVSKERKAGRDLFGEIDNWYPIQVKQQDRAGRPDLDKFETAMRRDKRLRGYFIAFGFSSDAVKEIKRANREDGLDIVPITVTELLDHERVAV